VFTELLGRVEGWEMTIITSSYPCPIISYKWVYGLGEKEGSEKLSFANGLVRAIATCTNSLLETAYLG
jgi:hypothetical protein